MESAPRNCHHEAEATAVLPGLNSSPREVTGPSTTGQGASLTCPAGPRPLGHDVMTGGCVTTWPNTTGSRGERNRHWRWARAPPAHTAATHPLLQPPRCARPTLEPALLQHGLLLLLLLLPSFFQLLILKPEEPHNSQRASQPVPTPRDPPKTCVPRVQPSRRRVKQACGSSPSDSASWSHTALSTPSRCRTLRHWQSACPGSRNFALTLSSSWTSSLSPPSRAPVAAGSQ